MPKYLIAYRKTEESGQKPEWAVFTTDSELSLEAHAVKERVEKRMGVLARSCEATARSCGSATAASTTCSTGGTRPPPRRRSSTA